MGNNPNKPNHAPVANSNPCPNCRVLFRTKKESCVMIFDKRRKDTDVLFDIPFIITPWGVPTGVKNVPCVHGYNLYNSLLKCDVLYPKIFALYKYFKRKGIHCADVFWYIINILYGL